jgi:hypothetical protein
MELLLNVKEGGPLSDTVIQQLSVTVQYSISETEEFM